ncbi:MAG: hypothetical protein AAF517_08565, partial [Planctomycetota bacterium]
MDGTVRGNRLGIEQWEKVFRAWEAQTDDVPFSDPRFGMPDESGEMSVQIWRRGSIRGVHFTWRPESRELDVRLPALASRSDWIHAFTILRTGLSHGEGTLEIEGEPIPHAELTREEAIRRATHDFMFSAAGAAQDSESVLPLGEIQIELSAEEVRGCSPETIGRIEGALARRVNGYMTAYQPRWRLYQTGHRVTSWALIPTAVDKSCDLISVAVEEVSLLNTESVSLPLDTLVEVLGDRVENLGRWWFLPEIGLETNQPLINAIKSAAEQSPSLDEMRPKNPLPQVEGYGRIDIRTEPGFVEFVRKVATSIDREEDAEVMLTRCLAGGLSLEDAEALCGAIWVVVEGVAAGRKEKELSKYITESYG